MTKSSSGTQALFLSWRGMSIKGIPWPPPPTMRESVPRPPTSAAYAPGSGELKKIAYPTRDYRRISAFPPVYEEVYGL